MDNFYEQLVKPKSDTLQILKKAATASITVILALFSLFLLSALLGFILGIVIAGVICYIGFYIMTCFSIEYEYIITNGEIDVDKIIAQRKRKRLVSSEIKGFTDFGKYNPAKKPANCTVVSAHDGIIENAYYADFKTTKFGQTRLIFSPDEKAMANIKPFLPRNLRN